jgi:hypothetical protein
MKEHTISQDEYIGAQKLYLGNRRWIGRITGIGAALMLGCAFAFAPKGNERILGIIAVCFAMMIIARPLLSRRRMLSLYRAQKSYSVPFTLSFDDDFLNSSAENGSIRTPWSDFIGYRENDWLFIVLETEKIMRIIPKAVFTTGDEMQGFVDCMQKKIKKR